MPMMTSYVLRFMDFTKIQKFRYLNNETFFSSNKKLINSYQGLLYGKKLVL